MNYSTRILEAAIVFKENKGFLPQNVCVSKGVRDYLIEQKQVRYIAHCYTIHGLLLCVSDTLAHEDFVMSGSDSDTLPLIETYKIFYYE